MTLPLRALDHLLQRLEYPRRRDLPWVIGVFADLSGRPRAPLPSPADRRFVDISRANFDRVLAASGPRVAVEVDDALTGPGRIAVDLTFHRLDDFAPPAIAAQVEPLRTRHDAWRAGGDADGRALEASVNRQLSLILHSPPFQALEATWRGLRYLVDTCDMARIRVLNISKAELVRTLQRFAGVAWDQSPIFKKIYDEACGQFGADPYSLLIADMGLAHTAEDCGLLDTLMTTCSAARAPVIAAASPALFEEPDFDCVAKLAHVRQLFRASAYLGWRTVREKPEARVVGLCLPRVLMRRPYRPARTRQRVFPFDEEVTRPGDLLWGNAAYAVGSLLVNRAMRDEGRDRGRDGDRGDMVLPLARLPRADAAHGTKAPIEAGFDTALSSELSSLGFITLAPRPSAHRVAITSPSSLATGSIRESPTTASASRDLDATLLEARLAQRLRFMQRATGGVAHIAADVYRQWRTTLGADVRSARRFQWRLSVDGTLVEIEETAGTQRVEIRVSREFAAARPTGTMVVRLV